MPRCSHCGKVNRDGSLFCQDCGHKLESGATAATAAVAPQPSAPKPPSAVCAACGTVNPPGMNFCKMCGTSLAAKSAPAPAAAPPAAVAADGKTTCPACGKQTPAGFSFCQHCGQRLGQPAAVPAAVHAPPAREPAYAPPLAREPAYAPPPAREVISAGALGVAATVAPSSVMPTPPAGMPRPAVSAPRPASVANGEALAATMAPAALMTSPGSRPVQSSGQVGRDTLMDPPITTAPAAAGQLISVQRDGTDGQSVPIVGEAFDIGRTEGQLKFLEDPYLAPRHARLITAGGKVVLRTLDAVNGVYVRIHAPTDLAPGDQFLVGKEVIRYEPLAPEERDPPSLVEHGVRIFGTVPREAWGRLRQLTVAGTTRDLWHLTRAELVLGREEGDVTFPDDEFMSRRHAAIKRQAGKARIEDLSSSNGTFLRVRGDRELKPGDVLRMGDQLLRFEA
jgi:pSer/pThr/pTyr-binding forkhead associated (FHA) protein